MTFSAPAVLYALIALPAIWWLLRLTPPRPRTETFPPTRLLLEITRSDETPSQTPWWLVALRLLLAALLIIALAGPILRPTAEEAPGDGPILIVIDNGWASAERFEAMRATALSIVRLAAEANRPVALVATAEAPGQIMASTAPEDVVARIDALEPQPFAANVEALLPPLGTIAATAGFGGAAWLSDGLGGPGADAIAAFLADAIAGPVVVYDDPGAAVVGLLPPASTAEALTVPVLRQDTSLPATGLVIAEDLRGRPIAESQFAFGAGVATASATFDLPTELRNDIVRLRIAGEETAGAVQLLDERYRRRTVGIVGSDASGQPLLSAGYYLTRALAPFADVRAAGGETGPAVAGLIDAGVSAIILADIGTLPDDTEQRLQDWVEGGGTLIRFAGPRLAASVPTLIPVALRQGGRTLGGALSWEEPQPMGAFPRTSPFFGLAVPDDILVQRQVLAEPDVTLVERSWAVLGDGTPLVTGGASGNGLLVLFHVTADTSWSNLPLSGVFVEMLRRVVAMSSGAADTAATEAATALAPYRVLDGRGRFVEPGAAVQPIVGGAVVTPDAAHPPGLYGAEDAFRAVSLLAADATLPRLDAASLAGAVELRPYPTASPIELRPWLLVAAFLVLLLDALAVLWLGGALTARRVTKVAAAILAGLLVLPHAPDAVAQQATLTPADERAMAAANQTALAYVITGNPENDSVSRSGLFGLSMILAQRTAFVPGEPIGIDLATDELAFYPLIYFRIAPDAPMPTPEAIGRLDAYMRNGGVVLFDTADQLQQAAATVLGGATPAGQRLQDMLATLDLPALEPVPEEHVLTRSFYLLSAFPGRLTGGPLWTEATERPVAGGDVRPGTTDGVSPILVTGNDFAAAWAVDERGAFLFPTSSTAQRETAFRSGVNIVMYALTGNYKTDQVHIPALLERLGE
ncbi:MAG: DUF4159 domain-containing protein [Bauldia sp.]|nr:DUF4159 domain-containing protein [Bauldia sp.]